MNFFSFGNLEITSAIFSSFILGKVVSMGLAISCWFTLVKSDQSFPIKWVMSVFSVFFESFNKPSNFNLYSSSIILTFSSVSKFSWINFDT